jgi:hypothetical protein
MEREPSQEDGGNTSKAGQRQQIEPLDHAKYLA